MLEIRFLGQFEVLLDGNPVLISTRNAQALFAYLVLNASKAQRRERLAGMLWPDSSEESARGNLRHEIWRLRKAFGCQGASFFLVDNLTITFSPSSTYSLDVSLLDDPALESAPIEVLAGSLLAYHDRLLPGFYDEWIIVERDRLHAIFEARLARLLQLLEASSRWAEVILWANRWNAFGQWPETAYRALITAHASSGDLSKAAATYEHFEQGLQKDLGVRPSAQTQELYRRVKAGWKIAHPSQPDSAPPIPAFPVPRMRRTNLPRPLTSFIGREKEIAEVTALATSARMVTITGSGGVGKTRLAIQVADALAPNFPDGAWWVGLAALKEAGSGVIKEGSVVIQAAARSLGIPERSEQPLIDTLFDALRERRLLLVLDNCEHLIAACAALAERLLGECQGITILATSREPMAIPGEKAWRLPSLSLPDEIRSHGQDALQSEAVCLFIERAHDARTNYAPDDRELATITQICQRLGGIPLAIELAAARMSLLSAYEIAARLDRRFNLLTSGSRTALPRHQTLWAAIEWSYDLLEPPEQILFRRLSVFSGSFTLEAAEAVCVGPDYHPENFLDLLGRLVDKSLMNVDPAPPGSPISTRYHFLDTIRTFGLVKLDSAEETHSTRDRHAEYYTGLVESTGSEFFFINQAYWYKALWIENENFRALVDWCAESDQALPALRLVSGLHWYWYVFGSHTLGRDLAVKALSIPSSSQFPLLRGKVLNSAGYYQANLGEIPEAIQSLDEARSIFEQLGDRANLAWTLQYMGLALSSAREYDRSNAAFSEGLALIREMKNMDADTLLFFVGDVDVQKGDYARAREVYEESCKILRVTGNKSFLAYPLRRLGYLALGRDDPVSAWKFFKESLDLNVEVFDRPGATASFISMARFALYCKKLTEAARFYGVVEGRLASFNIRLFPLDQAELRRISAELRSSMEETAFTHAFTEGWKANEDQALRLVGEDFGD